MEEKVVLLIAIFITIDKNEVKALNTTEVNIKDLEDQKDALYNQINIAIDDTVNNLKQYNDSDALLTLNHMKELKKQIKLLNGTEDDESEAPQEIFEGSLADVATNKDDNTSDVRRYAAIVSDKQPHIKLELKEILELLKNQGKKTYTGEKKIEMDNNKKIIEEKLQLWILQRQMEKERIQKMNEEERNRYRMGKEELCPKEGTKKKGKRSKLFRRKETIRRKRKNVKVYPCCRHCCNRSVMGCI